MTGPRPAAPPGTEAAAPTPGQAAYEAFEIVTCPNERDRTPWDDPGLDDKEREAFTAAAQAVLNQAFPGLKRERDEAREQIGRTAAELVEALRRVGELEEERDALQGERDQLGGELTAARAEAGRLRRERDEAVDRAVKVGTERNQLADTLQEIADGEHEGRSSRAAQDTLDALAALGDGG